MTYLTAVPQADLMRTRGNRRDTPRERHRDIMSLFAQFSDSSAARSEGGVLFRLDRPQGSQPVYLVRSKVPVTVGVPGIETIVEPPLSVQEGQPVSFRLAVNAVQRNGDKMIRSVVPDDKALPQPENGAIHLTPWLQKRLAPALKDVKVLNHQREVLSESKSSRGAENNRGVKTVQIDTIEGVAIVEDPSALQQLLENGIGRAKAYGCGLLTVKRIG